METATLRSIVEDAMRSIGLLTDDKMLAPEDANDALRMLNEIINEWHK